MGCSRHVNWRQTGTKIKSRTKFLKMTSLSLCLNCVCVFWMHVCMCVPAHTEVSGQYKASSSVASHLSFKTGFLTELVTYQLGKLCHQKSQGSFCFLVLEWQTCATTSRFYSSARDPCSDPHYLTVSILPTQLSSQSPLYLFLTLCIFKSQNIASKKKQQSKSYLQSVG